MENRSHRNDINRPKSRHGHKYSKYKMCLSMMLLLCIKLSWVEKKNVAYKTKRLTLLNIWRTLFKKNNSEGLLLNMVVSIGFSFLNWLRIKPIYKNFHFRSASFIAWSCFFFFVLIWVLRFRLLVTVINIKSILLSFQNTQASWKVSLLKRQASGTSSDNE